MNLAQRMKLLKHFGSLPPDPRPPLLVVPVSGHNSSINRQNVNTVCMCADQGLVSWAEI